MMEFVSEFDTISQESVGVGAKIFATISQMLISNFSWH